MKEAETVKVDLLSKLSAADSAEKKLTELREQEKQRRDRIISWEVWRGLVEFGELGRSCGLGKWE